MDNNPHQAEFRALVDRLRSRQRAADLLSEITGDKVERRTIYRWLADPAETTNARRCPGWALVLLRQAVEERGDD